MSLEPGFLFVSLITGAIGFVLIAYGRKQRRWPQLLGGALFCIYPYFFEDVFSMVIVGMVLGAFIWFAIRQGW